MNGKPKTAISLNSPPHSSRLGSSNTDLNIDEDSTPSVKRVKRSLPRTENATVPASKKGRACIACRRLKVKCDSAERGSVGCSRCQRLGIQCVSARRLAVSTDEDGEATHPAILRLNHAVEDILRRMNLPPLSDYSKPATNESGTPTGAVSEFQHTRENSGEPSDKDEITPAPMGSLYEVTQLNALRGRLRNARLNQRSLERNSEHDLIAKQLVSQKDAEEMLELYKKTLARYLWAVTIPEDTSLTILRESSTLLFTAVMLVSALHIPGKEKLHAICHKHFLDLTSTSMFEHSHTLDDIRGLCIAAFWQPDLSWKLSGLCVRMATELNLHQAFYTAFYSAAAISDEHRKVALEKARIWYLLYVLDHHFSIAYGRPPVTAALVPIKEHDTFVASPWCTSSDRRLISQVPLFVILSEAFEVFGLEPDRAMAADPATLATHARFTSRLLAWRDRWKSLLVAPDKFVADFPYKGVLIHHHFAALVLNSLALRGRPLDALAASLPPPLRPVALAAVDAAHDVLRFFLDEPLYRDGLVGIPLYLHSMIAFAVVFLIKLAHRWHAIGGPVDPEATTRPLIQGVVAALRACRAGANHMVYSMAEGFERMLETDWAGGAAGRARVTESVRRTATTSTTAATAATAADVNGPGDYRTSRYNTTLPAATQGSSTHVVNDAVGGDAAAVSVSLPADPGYDAYLATEVPAYSGGDGSMFETDVLWSAGMGYDLLHTDSGARQEVMFGDLGLGLGMDFYGEDGG